jgi:hypothetical protein
MSTHSQRLLELLDAQQRERLSVIARKLPPGEDRELLLKLLARAYCCHPLSELRS